MSFLHTPNERDSNNHGSANCVLSRDLIEAFNTLSSSHRKACSLKCIEENEEGEEGGRTVEKCQKSSNFRSHKRGHMMESQKVEAAAMAAVIVETEISRLENSIAELEGILM